MVKACTSLSKVSRSTVNGKKASVIAGSDAVLTSARLIKLRCVSLK